MFSNPMRFSAVIDKVIKAAKFYACFNILANDRVYVQ